MFPFCKESLVEYISVVMLRENLKDIPQYPLPEGYRMRTYRRGDRKTWLAVLKASEPFVKITGKTFNDNFGSDLPAMFKRCYFLVAPDGQDTGTITVWYEPDYARRPWGRIHWVAIVPEHQRRGLSKPMMTVAMNRLRSLGHRRAMLTTQTPRLAAIKTYLDFGFVPVITPTNAARAWKLVDRALRHPVLDAILT